MEGYWHDGKEKYKKIFNILIEGYESHISKEFF
jgi:hypothetical protein